MEMNTYEKEHLNLVRKAMPECCVLLKSDGTFPLKEVEKVALYGNGARNTVKGGTGSGEVNTRFAETIESGLEKAGFDITTKSWLDKYDACLAKAKKDFMRRMRAEAKKAHTSFMHMAMGAVMPEPEYESPLDGAGDLALYILARNSGEGHDRKPEKGDVLLTDTEIRDILALAKKYKRFMLVLNVGGVVDLTPVKSVPNILLLSQLGAISGTGLADILLGKENPSGKLSTTWAAWEDYFPMEDFGTPNDTRYKEGVYVGYRYFDTFSKEPLFPFGYGLSYTSFQLVPGSVSIQEETVTVSVKVTNTGNISGKEVVQLYVSIPSEHLDQPEKVLAAFQKTRNLSPGESQTLSLAFTMSSIASYSEKDAAYLLEKGTYVLSVGNSSRDVEVCGGVKVETPRIVRRVKNALGKVDFTDLKPSHKASSTLPAHLPVVCLHPECIQEQIVDYKSHSTISGKTSQLSDEDLVKLSIGAFDPKAGAMSIIGNASQSVAGAAGETAHVDGFRPIVMADGPAGLRLARDYFKQGEKSQTIGFNLPETVYVLLPAPLRLFLKATAPKPPKGAEILHQYATMIPIGTAIAQSWNEELAAACGDLVGAEMERFNVQLWLAPALNIHRSILCGRNFEYYSEDPLLSGKMAAAVTRGVQKHPYCGTTIKHFAANNQENNRYFSNSMVSERAMREIYLKGFEICVREAAPKAVMTSYNLLNGTHTSERRDLMEILRSEWGFDGIVMTDWIVDMGNDSKTNTHPAAQADKVTAAGSTLVMPGVKADYEKILAALKQGSIDRTQLQENATRILNFWG